MTSDEYYDLLRIFSNKDFEELKKMQAEVDPYDATDIQPLIGNDYNEQFTEQDIIEFFSPIAKVILDCFDRDELFELIINKNEHAFRYVILKTHAMILKFTMKENKAIINAVYCRSLYNFYFASYESSNFKSALDSILMDLNEQIEFKS